ncbi:ATP-binding protein [Vibrio alginolyticus]|uniref:ATP-binding protein n=2 Tax=Vibrio harveyi group TaxID=717610 RepID=UPI0006D04625|nr:ATP-binding protein [Vibrio alginolyticus]ELB2280592.1 ATP-binding protein [Vibrio alginolyticus]MCS0001795.1 ATP-binding protein [Vibrio alginolyticus]
MTEKRLSASNSGVRNKFNRVSKAKAFAEYIWNSLDSGATNVEINVRSDQELNQILDITITDNGSGIEMKGDISPFDKFEESSKKNTNDPLIKGKHGRGRLSFFKFCSSASWISKHKNNDRYIEIKITDGSLDRFIINQVDNNDSLSFPTGTRVTFNELNLTIDEFNKSFVSYLESHVTWICKVKKNIKLTVNGHELHQAEIINESNFERDISSDNVQFDVIAWKNAIENESPHLYFCDLDNNVITKKKYKAKNSFNCSCVISSKWFSQFHSNDDAVLTSKVDLSSEKFQAILKCATDSLDEKYLELKKSAIDELIDEYEREGIISKSQKSPLSRFKTEQLKDAIRVIFQADATVFTELANKKQKTILVKLIDRIVNSDDPDSLFEVLDGVISLSDSDMKILSNTLEKVTMTNIVRTIKQLEDRLHALDLFEKLLENKNDTYEVAHIQKIVESNMWIFGEEFNVLTTEEDKFDRALRKYLKFKDESLDLIDDIENEDYHPKHYDKYSIDHQHKQKEMDIFASQKMPMYDQGEAYFKNIIVELKRPSVKLTDKELQQIKNYMNVVNAEENFDTTKDQWDFVLVGNQISTNPQKSFNINMDFKNSKVHGKPGLAGDYGNMRVWVKEWSQIIGDYKLRYNHIIKSLNRKYDEVLEDNPDNLTQNIKSLSNV